MPDPVWKELGFDSEDDYKIWVARNNHLDALREEAAKKRRELEEAERKKKKKRLFD